MEKLTESTLNDVKRAWVKSIYNWKQFVQDQEDTFEYNTDEIDYWDDFYICYYEELGIPEDEDEELIIIIDYLAEQHSIRHKVIRAIEAR